MRWHQNWTHYHQNTMQALDRLRCLEELFLNGVARSHGQAFSVETLLDILIVLYDECCSSTLRREKSVLEFVKFGKFCIFVLFPLCDSKKDYKLHVLYTACTQLLTSNFSVLYVLHWLRPAKSLTSRGRLPHFGAISHSPAASLKSPASLALNLVNWFSAKWLQLLPPDVIY